MDAGYLSRILRAFETAGVIVKETGIRTPGRACSPSPTWPRQFAPIETQTNDAVNACSANSRSRTTRLVDAMGTIEDLLGHKAVAKVPYILRPPRAGDMGWIVGRHGVRYGEDYGWDEQIEALTAEIVATFVRNYDARRERCWIAERNGENVGSVLLVKETDQVARLRLLLVEPQARGLGIGARLVDECVRFARATGYEKVTLWTHSILTAARHIYQQAGFSLVHSWSHDEFGKTLTGETWDLELRTT